jgi:hypothetical protein
MSTTSVLRRDVSVRRGADRRQTRIGWLHGRHSFDTGVDPLGADTHHGVLIVAPWSIRTQKATPASSIPIWRSV